MRVPTATHTASSLEALFNRLPESHDLSAYEAIERLLRVGETVGLDGHALVRLLDRGMTFEEMLELIAAKSESSEAA